MTSWKDSACFACGEANLSPFTFDGKRRARRRSLYLRGRRPRGALPRSSRQSGGNQTLSQVAEDNRRPCCAPRRRHGARRFRSLARSSARPVARSGRLGVRPGSLHGVQHPLAPSERVRAHDAQAQPNACAAPSGVALLRARRIFPRPASYAEGRRGRAARRRTSPAPADVGTLCRHRARRRLGVVAHRRRARSGSARDHGSRALFPRSSATTAPRPPAMPCCGRSAKSARSMPPMPLPGCAARLRDKSVAKLVDGALEAAGAKVGLGLDDMHDLAAPDYGIGVDGTRTEMLGTHAVTLAVVSSRKATLTSLDDVRPEGAAQAWHSEGRACGRDRQSPCRGARRGSCRHRIAAAGGTRRDCNPRGDSNDAGAPRRLARAFPRQWPRGHALSQAYLALQYRQRRARRDSARRWNDLVGGRRGAPASGPETSVRLWHPLTERADAIAAWRQRLKACEKCASPSHRRGVPTTS